MNNRILGVLAALSMLVVGAGCGASRDVSVTGQLETASGVSPDSPILLDVYETTDDGEALVETFELQGAGAFEETISVEGDTLRFVALVDSNGNSKCDAGEAWGEATVEIDAEDTATFALRIGAQAACPVAAPVEE